jgi:hypothetical protein
MLTRYCVKANTDTSIYGPALSSIPLHFFQESEMGISSYITCLPLLDV